MKKYKNQVEENEALRLQRNEQERAAGLRHVPGFRGATIAEIEPLSIAEELGIAPGARLVEINAEAVRDSIQLKMADAAEKVTLTIIQPDGEPRAYDIEKDAFEPLGIGVDSDLFDGVTRCTNKCPFCFVDQQPPRLRGAKNLRRTLYVRDDDFRLSFLHGHYITLTNLKEHDYRRIIEQKLSPLYVSVHATDPATRIRMVGNASGGDIMERLRFLIDNGISINAQIVLCPGINDGDQLDRSVTDLMTLWPGIESLAVVPVGLTKFMPAERNLRTVQPEEARQVLTQLKPHQERALESIGVRFVYGSDEFYLLAGKNPPGAEFYDGFPQFANGVGLIRVFLDEIAKLRRRKVQNGVAPRITLVTGALAAPALRQLAEVLAAKNIAHAEVAEIHNTYWGGNVGCAGLIMGEEILTQLRGRDCGEMIFLPPDAVDAQRRMLDDVTLEQLAAELGATVRSDATGPLHMAQLLSRN
jgi:putative radical SAM enzyme (TIGR03279 family)